MKELILIKVFACFVLISSTSNIRLSLQTLKMLDTVFNAAEARLDPIGQNLLQYKAGIKSGSIEIKYHRNCCSTLQAHIK